LKSVGTQDPIKASDAMGLEYEKATGNILKDPQGLKTLKASDGSRMNLTPKTKVFIW